MKRMMHTEKVGATDGTWAQGVSCKNMLFISGQIGCDTDGNPVGDDFTLQAKRALENLADVLKEGGCTLEDLVSICVYVTDMDNRPAFAKIRREYFEKNPPASTIVEISRLCDPALLIEISGIAVRQGAAKE